MLWVTLQGKKINLHKHKQLHLFPNNSFAFNSRTQRCFTNAWGVGFHKLLIYITVQIDKEENRGSNKSRTTCKTARYFRVPKHRPRTSLAAFMCQKGSASLKNNLLRHRQR